MTTTTICHGCGAVITGGGRHCRNCRGDLMADVRASHDLLRELDLTLSRQDNVAAPSGGRKSATTPLPFHIGASMAAAELRAAIRAMAATHEVTPDHVRRFRAARLNALTTVDIPDPRVFLGVCTCATPLYARQHDTEVRCRVCGEQWEAIPADTSGLLDKVGHHSGTAAEVAGLLRMAGLPVPTDRVHWWARAGYLAPVGVAKRGWPKYRIADVIAVFARQAPKQRRAS